MMCVLCRRTINARSVCVFNNKMGSFIDFFSLPKNCVTLISNDAICVLFDIVYVHSFVRPLCGLAIRRSSSSFNHSSAANFHCSCSLNAKWCETYGICAKSANDNRALNFIALCCSN